MDIATLKNGARLKRLIEEAKGDGRNLDVVLYKVMLDEHEALVAAFRAADDLPGSPASPPPPDPGHTPNEQAIGMSPQAAPADAQPADAQIPSPLKKGSR